MCSWREPLGIRAVRHVFANGFQRAFERLDRIDGIRFRCMAP